ncbi:MAG: penicillin amidase family protein [uncultured Nocardioidaceae bacterium]|uniref:Penicillin amidase family protein n=1 Tax=uncultured Nocardioidaceae bacterium TaxID=253824 RepID=A0A6J4LSQ4_9ACTN|nr:MAG: penicillin amidase family protein [uncultured Nocardioidaceae bacterium]
MSPPAAGVRRDRWGIPHVVGGSDTEVAFLQGRSAVEDRAWQLEHSRLRAEGRAASVLGASELPWDRFARRVLLDDLGRRAFAALSAEARAFVAAYVEGVNDGLASLGDVAELAELGHTPDPWEPWTPLSVFAGAHVLFASFPSKLWRRHLDRVVGAEVAPLFHHEGLWTAGSNSWAVGAARADGGLPMVGGDPHRTFESPNVYQQVRLTSTGAAGEGPAFDVVGFTFPGVPGVQHFATAGQVAWGITNAMADYQDVYVERLERRGDEVWAEGPDGWRCADRSVERLEVRGGDPEGVEVVVTARGPVFWGGPGEPETLSLRSPSWALGELGFECLLPLLHARSSDDVVATLRRHWVEPVNNLVVADVSGDVRQQVVGRVPERPEENRWRPVPGWDAGHAWTGWVSDLPGRTVPPDGHVVTANHRMDESFDRVGVEFAPPGRGTRIEALLRDRRGLTRDDFAAIHRDDLAGQPAALVAAVTALDGLTGRAADLQAEIAGWDQRMAADSTTAAAYVDVRDNLVSRLLAVPPLERLDEASPYGPLFESWFALPPQLFLSLGNLLSEGGRRLLPGLDRHLADAVSEVAAGPRRRWGRRHRFSPAHALGHGLEVEPPLAGDNDCVRCTGGLPGGEVAVRGSVARYVWDLAGLDRSGWVVPLGASGDPSSAHATDQMPSWVEGVLLPLAE